MEFRDFLENITVFIDDEDAKGEILTLISSCRSKLQNDEDLAQAVKSVIWQDGLSDSAKISSIRALLEQ